MDLEQIAKELDALAAKDFDRLSSAISEDAMYRSRERECRFDAGMKAFTRAAALVRSHIKT